MKHALFCLLLTAATAQATAATPPFVGRYDLRSVDSVGSLALLPDQRFCFSFSGGALDMLLMGKWQSQPAGKEAYDLTLTQESSVPSRYALQISDNDQVTGDAPPAERRLLLNGALFSMMQTDTLLGWGSNTAVPANLAPLFAPDQSSFERIYRLDLPKDARYLFFGHLDEHKRIQLERFDTQGARYVWASFSPNGAQHGKTISGHYDPQQGGLSLANMKGQPKPISKALQQEIEDTCFSPPAPNEAPDWLTPSKQSIAQPWSAPPQAWFGR